MQSLLTIMQLWTHVIRIHVLMDSVLRVAELTDVHVIQVTLEQHVMVR
jgi:hypothetical protein